MIKRFKLYAYVFGSAALAALALAWANHTQSFAVSPWQLIALIFVALVLDLAGNPLRVAASGSMSFVVHMAAFLLCGGFWGGVVAGTSTLGSQAALHRPPLKTIFNVSQRILCIAAGAIIYQALGGQLPPSYLFSAGGIRGSGYST